MYTEKIKNLILCIIFGLAIFLIVFDFTETPQVWVDEGIFTNVAKNVARHGVLGLQASPAVFLSIGPQLSTNYPVIFPVALSLKTFGNGIWQARLPMVLYMFIFVVLAYLYTRRVYGFMPAVISVLLLISFSPFYGNGRSVQGEVPGLVFMLLGALLLLLWEKTGFNSKKFAIISGLSFGLSASTKSVYLIILSVALCITCAFWIKKIESKKTIVLFVLGFITPIIAWFCINFPSKALMMQIIPTFLLQAGNNGASSLSSSSLSTFETITTNLFRFFTESTPVLFMFLLISVVCSLALRYLKKDREIGISEFLLFLFIGLNWSAYLLGTGWYRYFFPANTLLYLLFPGAILYASQYVKKESLKKMFYIIPGILIMFQFYHLVFLSDTSFVVNRTRNSELNTLVSDIPDAKKVLFYNASEAIVFLKGDNYWQYLSMPGLFQVGDKDFLYDTSFDFIVATGSHDDSLLSCYERKSVDRYSFFQKISNCKK